MTHNGESNQNSGSKPDSSSVQGTEAEHKGGTEPAKEQAHRDFEDSAKEDGE